MTLHPASLEAAIRAGDAVRVRALLRDATEADRRACAKELHQLLTGPRVPVADPVGPAQPVIRVESMADAIASVFADAFANMMGAPRERSAAEVIWAQWQELTRTPAFLAAAVGLSGGRVAAARVLNEYGGFDVLPDEGYAAIAGVLADRNPGWLADLLGRQLAARWQSGVNSWLLARWLVRLGAIERPDIPEYAVRMPSALSQHSSAGGPLPLGALLADPGLLEDEVWRLFTVPGVGAEMDFLGEDWSEALATLAERGLLDRARLLDACLDAFVRDFPPNHVGWYVKFHDRLAPSPEEMTARSARYLVLLAVPSKTGVTLGQRVCGMLLDAGLLEPAAFLAASGPALLFPQKSAATAQLKLIGKVATGGSPSVRDRALVAAAAAFGHLREDVQQVALNLLAKYGVPANPAARASIIDQAAALSPTLAPAAAALGLLPAPAGLAESAGDAPATPSEMAAVSDLAFAASGGGPRSSLPVTDPAELVQLLAQLIEDSSDALAVERAMAGAVRLASLPLAERARLAAPLLKRAAKQANDDADGPFSGHVIRADMAWLTGTWATGRPPVPREVRSWLAEDREEVSRSGLARTMAGILSARVWEACGLIASASAGPLLAEPEFTDGTISHGVLLDRLARLGSSRPPRHDLEVALLRLAPGADEAFWTEWARIDAPSAPAARRAYTEGLAPLDFEPQVCEQGLVPGSLGAISMEPTRTAPVVAARLIGAVPADATSRASRCWQLLTDLANPALDEHGRRGLAARWNLGIRMDEVVAAWPLLCPHQPELVAAHLLRPLSDGLLSARSAATTAVESLAPAGRPFGKIGHLALVTGLASAEPDTRIAAGGIWTRASRDGGLDPALAASAITLGVTESAFKLNRLADALQYATLEPAAASAVASAAVTATAALLPAKPPGLHLLLEVAARAAATSGATGADPDAAPALPPAIADLVSSRDRTKLAEAARRLARLTHK